MEPFIGQITMFTGNIYDDSFFQWGNIYLPCNGSEHPIQGHQALYAVIGTTYGGNGKTTFKVPDLQGRVPYGAGAVKAGSGLVPLALGQSYGVDAVQLTTGQTPFHRHEVNYFAAPTADSYTATPVSGGHMTRLSTPPKTAGGTAQLARAFAPSSAIDAPMSGSTVSPYGQQNPQPHENRQPYLTIIFGIAHTGILPVKNAP